MKEVTNAFTSLAEETKYALDEPVLIIEPLTYPMEGWMEV